MSNGIPKGPNVFHPEKPGAVGSRNSVNRSGRDEYAEAQTLIDEEVDKVLNHVSAKLPPEALEKLHVGGTLKDILHNYFNQSFQNMFNRYLTTVEDEMSKKFRDLLDKDEFQNLNRYSPREIGDLLEEIGGTDKFNTGEVEKSMVNIFGHAQGHIQRGMYDLEMLTNNILRQKVDVGAFVRGEITYAVVKCSFRNNSYKPEAVSDIRLIINVLDDELISPVYHYQVAIESIIKDIVSDHIFNLVDREVEKISEQLMDEGQDSLMEGEEVFEKFRSLEQFMDHGELTPESGQYTFVDYYVYEAINGISAEIDISDFDALGFRENIKRVVDVENLRNRGYNTAVNALTGILDTSRMGYQHIENYKNAREIIIREYEDTNVYALPDERYSIKLSYYDDLMLRELRNAYSSQVYEFDREIDKLWDVADKIFKNNKKEKNLVDFDDVAEAVLGKNNKSSKKQGWFSSNEELIVDEEEKEDEKLWDEVTFITPKETDMESMNATFSAKRESLLKKLHIIETKMYELFGTQNPTERIILEQRLNFLRDKFVEFNAGFNPFHVQPGLLLEVQISTIKRRQTTMDGMSNVLNEFLSGISKGFSDKAFTGYSRRRSTIKTDLEEEFQNVFDEGTEESAFAEGELTGVAELD
ncbi:MAG: hypothetical protein ACI86H_000222 [bacterium]|jgi:hypothetical protein